MMSTQRDVREFMEIAGQGIGDRPAFPDNGSTGEFDVLVELHKAQAEMHAISARLAKIPGILALRARLMIEETAETVQGMADLDMKAVADGLVDDLYVTIGTAVALGIDLEPLWDAVHGANLDKAIPCPSCAGMTPPCKACHGHGLTMLRDPQGKVLKRPGWKPTDLGPLLVEQGWVPEKGP